MKKTTKKKKKKPQVPLWLRLPKHWPQDWAIQLDGDISDLEIFDFATWLTDKQLDDPALVAVWQADKTSDAKTVIDLLASKVRLTVWGRKVVADWLVRTTSSEPGRKTPVYIISQAQLSSEHAVDAVRSLLREGMSKSEAIKKIAHNHDIPESTLRYAVKRGRQSTPSP